MDTQLDTQLNTQIETVNLKRFAFNIQHKVSKALMLDTSVDVSDFYAETFTVNLRVYLYGIDHKGVEIKYPRDWVEALKERWLPEWLKKRYPVKYTVRKINFREIYPKIQPKIKLQEVTYKTWEN